MAKRSRGTVFLSLGFLLIAVAIGWYVYNICEDKSAGEKSAQILSKFDNAQKAETDESAPVVTVDGDAFCGKLVIEKLSLELPVYDKLTSRNLKSAPCRYIGGIETGNIIIAGHNYKSHFASLSKLEIGDGISFTDPYEKTHLYTVCELALLDGTAVSDMQSGGFDFTLFACTKSGEQRVTVRCQLKRI